MVFKREDFSTVVLQKPARQEEITGKVVDRMENRTEKSIQNLLSSEAEVQKVKTQC